MNTKKYKIILACVCILAAAASVLRCLMIYRYIDTGSDYTDYSRLRLTSNGVTESFPYIIVAIIAALVVFSVLLRRRGTGVLVFDGTSTVFFSSLAGFMMLTTAALEVYYYLSGAETAAVVDWAVVMLLVLTSAYFLYTASKNIKPRSAGYAVASTAPIFLMLVRLLSYFLKINSRPNSATSLFHLFSLAAIMLFFVYEGKFSVRSGSTALYVFFGLSAVLLTFVYAVPELVLSSFWLIAWQGDTMFSALDLLVCFFIIARLSALTVDEIRTEPTEN